MTWHNRGCRAAENRVHGTIYSKHDLGCLSVTPRTCHEFADTVFACKIPPLRITLLSGCTQRFFVTSARHQCRAHTLLCIPTEYIRNHVSTHAAAYQLFIQRIEIYLTFFNCSNGRVRSLSRCAKSEVRAYTYRVKNETPGAPEDSSSIACACFPREHFATQRRRSWRWIEKCARTHDVSHNEHFRIHGTYGTDMIIGNRSWR